MKPFFFYVHFFAFTVYIKSFSLLIICRFVNVPTECSNIRYLLSIDSSEQFYYT